MILKNNVGIFILIYYKKNVLLRLSKIRVEYLCERINNKKNIDL